MEDEDGHQDALKRYAMVDARLRRLCEQKASGLCRVPKAIHEQWKLGGKHRDELRVFFEKYDLDKESVSQIFEQLFPWLLKVCIYTMHIRTVSCCVCFANNPAEAVCGQRHQDH